MMATMIGIDPHKATHTAVAIGRDEAVLDEIRVRACAAQVERLRGRAATLEEPVWAIESAGGLGYLLVQQLVAAGDGVRCVSWAREDTQERLLIQRDRLNILNTGSSDKSLPGPTNHPRTALGHTATGARSVARS